MVHRVNQLWSRIEIQLQQISPADFNLLAAGCQEQDLEQLQNRLGLSLPIEVRASLLRHNGDLDNSPQLNDVGGMFRLFSDKQVLTEYRAKVEKWSWSGQQKWIEHSNNWPTMIALASSIDFNFNIDCLSGKVYLGRSGYNNADFIASDWSVVLEAWAVALEQKKYTVGVQGISVDNWAGLNPY